MSPLSPIAKCLLYPIVIVFFLFFYALIDYVITMFFAWLFECSLKEVITIPIIILYILSLVGWAMSVVVCCSYIDEEL